MGWDDGESFRNDVETLYSLSPGTQAGYVLGNTPNNRSLILDEINRPISQSVPFSVNQSQSLA